MTNSDKIRSMTDHELAQIIECPFHKDLEDCKNPTCWPCKYTWLKSETKKSEE